MERLTVAYIIDTLINPNAGTEGQFIKLVQGMISRGHTIKVYALRNSDYLASGALGVDVEVLGITQMASPLTVWRMLRLALDLRRQRVSLVQTFFNDASVIAPLFMRLVGCRIVISRRDMGFWYSPGLLRILRLNSRWLNAAVVNSLAVAQQTQESEHIPAERIHVIYNGYLPQNKAQNVISLPDGPVLGIVANIRPIKRMQDAVAALGALRDEFPDLQLVIVGAGDPSPLYQQADELGVAARLHCVGAQSEPQNYIQRFDIALLCSESEGFSNAIIECLQFGKPVICSRTGGNPEIVSEGENGFLYTVGDVTELTNCIRHLLTDPALLAQMSQQAMQSVASRFSMTNMLVRHEQLYQQIIAEGSNF